MHKEMRNDDVIVIFLLSDHKQPLDNCLSHVHVVLHMSRTYEGPIAQELSGEEIP